MPIEIESILYIHKSILRNLMELYQYDFSEFEGGDVNAQGLFGYRYLDHYWTEEGRHPFFIRVDGQLAGFILMRQVEGVQTIAEFFVMRKYRRQGVGREVAYRIFSMFPGRWRVAQEACNVLAQSFWRSVINEYTGGEYTELVAEVNQRWQGPMQEFIVSRGCENA